MAALAQDPSQHVKAALAQELMDMGAPRAGADLRAAGRRRLPAARVTV